MANDPRSFPDANRLTHLLWEVASRSGSLADAALASSPLTPSSSGVLDAISATPGSSIADLARWLPTSAQGISQLVSRLEKLGFLERRLGTRGYGVALFVTRTGEKARTEANDRQAALDRVLADALGERDHRQLIKLLTRTRRTLEEARMTLPVFAASTPQRPRADRPHQT